MDYFKVLNHSIKLLKNNGLIDNGKIVTQKRPPFYNKYLFRITISVPGHKYVQFNSLRESFRDITRFLCYFRCNSKTMTFYFYSDNPSLLRLLYVKAPYLNWGNIVLVHPNYHNTTLPPTNKKKKYQFYGKYKFRIKFEPKFNVGEKRNKLLNNEIRNDYYVSPTNPNMIYIESLDDLMYIKMKFNDYISDISDRSNCPKKKDRKNG